MEARQEARPPESNADTDADPASAPTGSGTVDLELTVTSPLSLRCEATAHPPAFELQGAVKVRITNRSAVAAEVLDLDTQGLVFEQEGRGTQNVVIHTCSCVELLLVPMHHAITLPPGTSKVLELTAPWAHDERPFAAPRPGRYRLRYRAVMVTQELERDEAARRDKHVYTDPTACNERLSTLFAARPIAWSNEVPVELATQGGSGPCRAR